MRRDYRIIFGVGTSLLAFIFLSYYYQLDWTGFGNTALYKLEENIIIHDSNNKLKLSSDQKKSYNVIAESKTLWDWMTLFLAPTTIAGLGFWFQSIQEKAREQKAIEEKAKIDEQMREAILQSYLNDLSILLVDKKLNKFFISSDTPSKDYHIDDDIDFKAALDIVKAKTLSIFRLFEQDVIRKASVLAFLGDTNLLKKLKIDISEINLEGANLRRANLTGSRLDKSNLSQANLTKVYLTDAHLNRANLSRSNLSDSFLTRAHLNQSILVDANFTGAHLFKADLTEANLTGTNLTDADLTEANLTGANLTGANLTRAILTGAILTGVNLTGAILVDTIDLNSSGEVDH